MFVPLLLESFAAKEYSKEAQMIFVFESLSNFRAPNQYFVVNCDETSIPSKKSRQI